MRWNFVRRKINSSEISSQKKKEMIPKNVFAPSMSSFFCEKFCRKIFSLEKTIRKISFYFCPKKSSSGIRKENSSFPSSNLKFRPQKRR